MNRYLAKGVIADMRAGKHVLVLLGNRRAICNALDCVIAAGNGVARGETVALTRGHESIRGAGRIDFSLTDAGLRGVQADVIVLDADYQNFNLEWWDELMVTVGRGAELIRR